MIKDSQGFTCESFFCLLGAEEQYTFGDCPPSCVACNTYYDRVLYIIVELCKFGNQTITTKKILFMKELTKNVYDTPVCKVLSVGTQGVICGSETEKVTETNGEW